DPDGDPLSFFFNFGDGAQAQGSCSVTHTYTASFRAAEASARGASAGRGQVRGLDASYEFEGCVVDPDGASQCRTRTVSVQNTPPPTCPTPTSTMVAPPPFTCDADLPVQATTTNANSATFCAADAGSILPCSSFARGTRDANALAAPPPTCVPGTPGGSGSFT